MPNWECPRCHVANLPDDTSCRACGRWRPSGWARETWRCKRCGRTWTNREKYCNCGFRPGFDEPSPPEAPPSPARGVLDDLMADMRRTHEALLGDLRRDLPAAGAAAPAGDVRPAAPPPPLPRGPAAFERVGTRHLQLSLAALPKLNYALFHAGLPLVRELSIANTSREPAHDLVLRAWIAPDDYGEAWERSVGAIPPGGVHRERDIVVSLRKARLQEVREAERASLRVKVWSEGVETLSDTTPLEVLAYNEWYFHPAIPHTAAGFVQPNAPAVDRLVSLVRDRLRREGRDPSLGGYQHGGPDRVAELAAALYATVQEDVAISYVNPPPSFERGERLDDGAWTLSQKVFFPEQILEHRRGTCLDLAFLGAACLERMGLHPLVFIVRGHAFFGAWTRLERLDRPFLAEHAAVRGLVDDGRWLALNSTTWTQGGRPFAHCLAEAAACLADPESFLAAIDVAAARGAGIKPIPPLAGHA